MLYYALLLRNVLMILEERNCFVVVFDAPDRVENVSAAAKRAEFGDGVPENLHVHRQMTVLLVHPPGEPNRFTVNHRDDVSSLAGVLHPEVFDGLVGVLRQSGRRLFVLVLIAPLKQIGFVAMTLLVGRQLFDQVLKVLVLPHRVSVRAIGQRNIVAGGCVHSVPQVHREDRSVDEVLIEEAGAPSLIELVVRELHHRHHVFENGLLDLRVLLGIVAIAVDF